MLPRRGDRGGGHLELGRAGVGVVRHDGLFQRSSVLEISGNPGRSEAVASGLGRNPGGGHAPPDHRLALVGRGGGGELAGAAS